ncbi:MAG: hypothetical protein ACOC5E_01200 [Acidobacteriota bacterium]
MRRSEQREGVARSPAPSISAGEYESGLFADLTAIVERLGRHVDILDLGPTTPANLMFWVRRGHRVTARDYLARRGRSDRGLVLGPDQSFGAIVAWNVLSFLPRSDARTLMAELQGYLMPGGGLFAIFDGDGRRVPEAVRYRIVDEGRLAFAGVDLGVAPRAVPTSEIEALLGSLPTARISVMRHGSREALARRPREEES